MSLSWCFHWELGYGKVYLQAGLKYNSKRLVFNTILLCHVWWSGLFSALRLLSYLLCILNLVIVRSLCSPLVLWVERVSNYQKKESCQILINEWSRQASKGEYILQYQNLNYGRYCFRNFGDGTFYGYFLSQ